MPSPNATLFPFGQHLSQSARADSASPLLVLALSPPLLLRQQLLLLTPLNPGTSVSVVCISVALVVPVWGDVTGCV